MKISYFESNESLSKTLAAELIQEVETKKDLVLCAATGNSPRGVYGQLQQFAINNPAFFKSVKIIGLDEWGGLDSLNPSSCAHYLNSHLIEPLGIEKSNTLLFDGKGDSSVECERMKNGLQSLGNIDFCLLGLGINGHVGFNEPAETLDPEIRSVQLSSESQGHEMIALQHTKPSFCLTLGLKSILSAGKIRLIVSGKGKEKVLKEFLEGNISTSLPASFLWLHGDAEMLVDRSSLQ